MFVGNYFAANLQHYNVEIIQITYFLKFQALYFIYLSWLPPLLYHILF